MSVDRYFPPKVPCMTEGCDNPREWKGLCRSCHGVAKRFVDEEKTTWDELAEMGLCLAEGKPFKVAFLKKKATLLAQSEPTGESQ